MQAYPLTTTTDCYFPAPACAGRVDPLENSEQAEVLAFLERRPIHTAYLAGMVRDNGVESELNRGTFYGYRNSLGELKALL